MEVYLLVPNNLENIYKVFEQSRNLFGRQEKRGIFVFSSFNETCIRIAREVAINVGCDLNISQILGDSSSAEGFPEKEFWPNRSIYILVVTSDVATTIAKEVDPGCKYDNIPMDVLYRLQDTHPETSSDIEDDTN